MFLMKVCGGVLGRYSQIILWRSYVVSFSVGIHKPSLDEEMWHSRSILTNHPLTKVYGAVSVSIHKPFIDKGIQCVLGRYSQTIP